MLFLEKPEKDGDREGVLTRESLRRGALLRNNCGPTRNGLVRGGKNPQRTDREKNRV